MVTASRTDQPTPRAHRLNDAFKILGISRSLGYELVRDGQIKVIRFTPGTPRITEDEIIRILKDGLVPPRRPRLVR
jgi:predicted site-specific integrase-resolvase